MRHIAVYIRVSTAALDQRSQLPDLKRWVEAYADGQPVQWYQDKASGKTMDRPGWRKLTEAMRAGSLSVGGWIAWDAPPVGCVSYSMICRPKRCDWSV